MRKIMKKTIFATIIFLFTCLYVNAQNLTYLKEDYELQFVQKNENNYINEYVRPSQNLENWTNIITVHYFPKIKNPETYVNNMTSHVRANEPVMYMIMGMPNKNLISFSIISLNDYKGYIEYNVLRAEPEQKGGIKVLQFAHKYKFSNKDEFTKACERTFKYNMKYINGLLNLQIPEIEKKNFEKK